MPALTGVRGIAILMVTVGHFTGWPAGSGQGVDLFFALSAFLITTLLLEERARTGRVSLRRFYARRSRRLFPALAAMLAVWAAFTPHPLVGVLAGATYITNLLVATSSTAMPASLDHLWSLAQEEQFYLVWPFLLAVLLRWRRQAIGPVLVSAIIVEAALRFEWTRGGVSAGFLQFSPFTRLDGVLVGSLFAILLRDRGRELETASRWILVAGVPLAVFCFLDVGPTSTALHEYLLPLLAITFAALVIVAATDKGRAARVLSVAPLVFLGEISYAFYLWQIPVLYAFHAHLALVWPGSLIALATTVAVATFSTRVLEPRFRASRPRAEAATERRAWRECDQTDLVARGRGDDAEVLGAGPVPLALIEEHS